MREQSHKIQTSYCGTGPVGGNSAEMNDVETLEEVLLF
jgi:hypothetical protein